MENINEFSFLKKIQNYVIKYANVIAEILNVDIEIVDDNLTRIAGTGSYSKLIDRQCEGMSYKSVINTGKHRIILEPSKDYLCEFCELKENCEEKLEIATPIFYNDKIIGVIGIVCFTIEKREAILKNVEENLRFLNNIAELISSKIYEEYGVQSEKNLFVTLDKLIKNVSNPIVIIDEENKISNLNEAALKKLSLEDTNISLVNNEMVNGFNSNVFFDREKYENQITEIALGLGQYKSIFIFNEKKQVIITEDNSKSNLKGVERIVGNSPVIKEMKKNIEKIALSTSTVLITGESGTGKELVARAIHEEGNRQDKPFIAINCAAIPETLLESELFGYAKGAFSGASSQGKMGKFELANNGIIFLDEIGDMPLYLQAKILRVLQDRQCVRIGSNKLIDLDIRILAATNKNLKKLVEENKFREDLYYRLNVIPIEIPALRERAGDIEIIMNNLIKKYERKLGKKVLSIDERAENKILKYQWPGNVRELENCIEYMINLAEEDGILKESLLPNIVKNNNMSKFNDLFEDEISLKEIEYSYIKILLNKYGSDLKGKKMVANKLGIGIATLYRKIEKLNINLE
ncbi:MAG: sigma-54 interaction domain-containing protein [Sarcina sp.]